MVTFVAVMALPLSATSQPPQAALKAADLPTLEYAAHEGCPSREALLAAVQERVGSRSSWWLPRGVRVFIERQARGSIARLTVESDDGETKQRELLGASCLDAASAVAIVLAESIEEAADSVPPVARERLARLPPEERDVDTPTTTRRSPSFRLGVGSGVLALRAPYVRPSAHLFVEVPLKESSSQPVLRLSALLTPVVSTSSDDGELKWYLGRVEGCPWAMGRSLVLRPCASVDAGPVMVRGNLVGGWVAPGAAGHVSVPASDFGIEGEVGFEVPLFRELSVGYRAPPIVPRAGVGVAVRFP